MPDEPERLSPPLYTRDDDGRLHCRHGVLLYGTGCVRCERGEGVTGKRGDLFLDDPAILTESPPCKPFATGFDQARPGSDKTAYATVHVVKLDRYEFTVEDIDLLDPKLSDQIADQLLERVDEAIARAIYGAATGRPTQEIITDPEDRRGTDARPVRFVDRGC